MMKEVNAVGDACPIPVIKTKKCLAEITGGQIEVLVDNDVAVQNVCRFADSEGCRYETEEKDGIFHITIVKEEVPLNGTASKKEEVLKDGPVSKENVKIAVVLSSDTMGSGSDELGRILMKGFIYALTQLDKVPDTVLLYNTGARLSVTGSESLPDLIALEKAGAAVKTCGTCLNYFGLADQLSVGEVTNMYSIVEELRDAGRILRP